MSKSCAMHFSKEEMELLRSNPCVRYVTENKVMWTLEYRTEMYERWVRNPSNDTIREVMKEHGIEPSLLGAKIISDISRSFKRNGRPANGGGKELYAAAHFHASEDDNRILVNTGKFRYSNKGIAFSDDFAGELYAKYPEQPIEDGLRAAGIDPKIVGYQRIHHLKQIFEGHITVHSESKVYSDEEIQKYRDHPYVKRITHKQLVLRDAFYCDAHPVADLPLAEVLNAFEIEPSLFSFSFFQRLKYKLRNTKISGAEPVICSEQTLRIQKNVLNLMEEKTEKNLAELKEQIPSLSMREKKKLFVMIHELPEDPGGVFTVCRILEKIGVSKSCYYSALKNDQYDLYEQRKEAQDEEDRKVIETVIAYKDHPKGKRMIYMMMKKITGKQFGLNKIMRLNRKYGMQCQIRKANSSRQASQALLKRNLKQNLLKRTFRLHRPDEVTLTDVTYIPYGKGRRVYGSACKDPVSGVLKAFNGSRNNDLNLVDESLNELKKYPMAEHPLFHSDQGTLYLTDTFQNKLKEMGFTQSMSKRGNCWDNASQESFFGHFKDEVDLSGCTCDEDVFRKMAEYQDYYNNERPQWTRNRMTPVQYAEYLKNMSDEEYESYLQKEAEKYNRMKQKAVEEAAARAKTLGI